MRLVKISRGMDIDELWDYSNPAASEERFRATAVAEPSQRGELLTQLARSIGLQRRFDEARATLELASSDIAPESRAQVRLLLERGRVENSSGNPLGAIPFFLTAFELAVKLGEDNLAVDAAHMLGITETGPAQMEWNMRALHLASSSSDPKAQKWAASLHNNIGWTLHDNGNPEEALQHFHEALRFRLERGDDNTIRIARWCIGRCLRSLSRYDEAMEIQRSLEQESSTGYVLEEIGELLLLRDNPDAKRYFAKAFELLSEDPWLSANEPERLQRLNNFGSS